MYWPVGAPKIYAASNPGPRRVVHDEAAGLNAEERERTALLEDESTVEVELQRTPNGDGGWENGRPGGAGSRTSSKASLKELEHTQAAAADGDDGTVVGLRVSRNGLMFATITTTTLAVWQTQPTAVLATVVRSPSSLQTYGHNVSLLLRPDAAILVLHTALGYLITYSLATDPDARVYKQQFADHPHGHARRHSISGGRYGSAGGYPLGPGEGGGVREVSIRFRMVIKIDAGIGRALALDEELVVATQRPAAVQCIRWTPDRDGNQTSTELLSRMDWVTRKTSIVDMVFDRPMSLATWVMSDGKAYAVQRRAISPEEGATKQTEAPSQKRFRGYAFHEPDGPEEYAVKAAINARFSLIAIGLATGAIYVYIALDYAGNIPLSHKLRPPVSPETSGKLTFLTYSPDGYCLFAGFERGWAMWSVYGKPGGNSFMSDRALSEQNDEKWLTGVREGVWISGGAEILLLGMHDERLWVLEMARSAVVGCFSASNISRSVLVTNSELMIYRGYDLSDLTTISAEASLWTHVPIPTRYLADQWPLRSVVASPDGRYVAIAGRRGLAHYSLQSARWKTFEDREAENSFVVRGGMCWFQHILAAAVEAGNSYELRLYSRELGLDNSSLLHVEPLPAPVVLISASGDDSLLVYTYENILYHFMVITGDRIQVALVGQIGFHGIVRSPARVRAVSWILPDHQLRDGDPAQDVAMATVIFLVDAKLVMLQPSTTEGGELKYDMRVLAQDVEYYALMRDQPTSETGFLDSLPPSPSADDTLNGSPSQGLKDSLWIFDGNEMKIWTDVHDVLNAASMDLSRDLPASVSVPVDFYPLSILLNKGIVVGVDAELVQRRDINYAFLRLSSRTNLFLPKVLRHYLTTTSPLAALQLAQDYQALTYFPHALEMLLHEVLDSAVDAASSSRTPSARPSPHLPPSETPTTGAPSPLLTSTHPSPTPSRALSPSPAATPDALLPTTLAFLAHFAAYLDILVQCTRKTELRSWRTLFAHLPPPRDLFDRAMRAGRLKTAGGYLIVLHTFNASSSTSAADTDPAPSPGTAVLSPHPPAPRRRSSATSDDPDPDGDTPEETATVRLLRRAKEEAAWDLCKELARFLLALDPSGETLRRALARVGLVPGAGEDVNGDEDESWPQGEGLNGSTSASTLLRMPSPRGGGGGSVGSVSPGSGSSVGGESTSAGSAAGDYFSFPNAR